MLLAGRTAGHPRGPLGLSVAYLGPKHSRFRMFLPHQGHGTQVRTKSTEHILGTATATRGRMELFWHSKDTGP